MEQCRPLREYMLYVTRIRKYAKSMAINQAVQRAVNECITEGILADFLIRNKAEVIQMSIFEYDEEKELKLIRQDEREMGYADGKIAGKVEGKMEGENRMAALIKYLLEAHLEDDVQKSIADPEYRRKMFLKYSI